MSQQKQNNFKELDELINLADEPSVNREALWQKLELRLQKKPAQFKLWWYWAAAILLICTTLPFLFGDGSENNVAAIIDDTPLTGKQTFAEPGYQPKTYVPAEIVKQIRIKNDFPVFRKNQVTSNNKFIAQKDLRDSFICTNPVESDNIVFNKLPENFDTTHISASITAKKEISVVHLSELEEEDRIANTNKKIARSFKKKRNQSANHSEYAGILNFRINIKN